MNEKVELQYGSPAFDAGAARFEWKSEVVFDLQLESYLSSAPDLGAYELNPASGSTGDSWSVRSTNPQTRHN
ncbi:MAG TPA: hypothetical protein VFC02_08490 [Anaerolineales bacterium]|nr:hypothetical protein [Anaerolineales bacterium]